MPHAKTKIELVLRDDLSHRTEELLQAAADLSAAHRAAVDSRVLCNDFVEVRVQIE